MVETLVAKARGGKLPSIVTSVSRIAACTTGGADSENFFTSSGGGTCLTNWNSSLESSSVLAGAFRSNSASLEPSSLRLGSDDEESGDGGPAMAHGMRRLLGHMGR